VNIAAWWASLSEQAKIRIVTTIGVILTSLYPLYQLGVAASPLWNREIITWAAATATVADATHKLSPDEQAEIKTWHNQTLVVFPNPTSQELKNVVVVMPVSGYAVLVDGQNTILSAGKFNGRFELARLPPLSGANLTVVHKEKWPRGEKIHVSTAETGKIELDPQAEPIGASGDWRVVGFWLLLIGASFLLIRSVVRRYVFGKSAGPNPTLPAPTPEPAPPATTTTTNSTLATPRRTNRKKRKK